MMNQLCAERFQATVVSDDQFVQLFDEFGSETSIVEVEESNVFPSVHKNGLV